MPSILSILSIGMFLLLANTVLVVSVYSGWTEAGQHVVVKFVRTYSKDLDEHCARAALALAPTLLGFEKLAGDWFMLVMEYLYE